MVSFRRVCICCGVALTSGARTLVVRAGRAAELCPECKDGNTGEISRQLLDLAIAQRQKRRGG